MKVSKEKIAETKLSLKIELDSDMVEEALKNAYLKIVKDVNLPGFRKGKVPRRVLEGQYGKEVLHKDALDFIYEKIVGDVLVKEDIEPIDTVRLVDYDLEAAGQEMLSLEVDVAPEITLEKYTDLAIPIKKTIVTEEQVNSVLENIQKQQAVLVETERTKVAAGDFVIIDFEGFIDKEPFPGNSAEDYSLEIGSNAFIPGFEEQLIGCEVNQEVKIEVDFPETYHQENLKGKAAEFVVKIKAIKDKELPSLDDNFAQTSADVETLDELKHNITQSLQQNAEEQELVRVENEILEAIGADLAVEIPEKMIEQNLEQSFQEVKQKASQQQVDFEKYLAANNMTKEKWMQENRGLATKQILGSLIVKKVADLEKITVSEEEIEKELNSIAEGSQFDKDTVKNFLQQQGKYDALINDIKRKKTMQFLIDQNTIEEEAEKQETK